MAGHRFMCWGRIRVKAQVSQILALIFSGVRGHFLVLLSTLGDGSRGKSSPVTQYAGPCGSLPNGTSLGRALHPTPPLGTRLLGFSLFAYKMRL